MADTRIGIVRCRDAPHLANNISRPMHLLTTNWLAPLLLLSTIQAQIAPGRAFVITEMANTPRSVVLEVDMATGKFVTLGRFGFDTLPPLGIAFDNVDRDLIVACRFQNGTRIIRLPLQGRVFGTPRVLADLTNPITDIEFGFRDSIFFTIGGANGGLFAIPRNGGAVRRVKAMPRARGIFNFGQGVYSGFVLQAGAPGMPVTDPHISALNYDNGKVLEQLRLTNYRPLDVTDVAVLPNAVLNKLVSNADGTVGEVILNKSSTIPLTPKLPAGATRRIRTFAGGLTAYVLGGKAHPRIKSFPGFGNGRSRPWTMLTGNLPGDPVDFDITPPTAARNVALGRACTGNTMHIGSRQTPSIGNSAFNVDLHTGAKNTTAALALGLSDDRFGNLNLPTRLPGGCTLYASIDTVLFRQTDNLGFTSQPLPVPNNPALAGIIVFGQWAQAKGTGLDTSAALAMHLWR